MTVSYRWLQRYFRTDASLEVIIQTLTDIGLEVEDVISFDTVKGGLAGLVIGHVLTREKHPNADKLSCTTVDLGPALGIQHIVCGAPNVAAGQKVVVAPVGTMVHPTNGEAFEIKAAKIRGEASNGMICAEDEIGLGSSHAGIMILPEDAPTGKLAAEYFQVSSDTLLEINLTPNRTDAMSHYGIARDLVAGLKARQIDATLIKPTLHTAHQQDYTGKINIKSENCSRYSALQVNIGLLKESPQWLKDSLLAIGVNSINHLVDITNYVLHEQGQPLHAFDADKIQDQEIIVRQAQQGETLLALDGQTIKLTEEDLVIAGTTEVLCLAGIYGGKNSGVNAETTKVILESACFNGTTLRKSGQRHNLRTDALQKFEKGTDINNTVAALQRAAQLILDEYPHAVFSEIKDLYPNSVTCYPVGLRLARLNVIAGRVIDPTVIQSILTDLGIVITKSHDDIWELEVPTFKIDVRREEDVIEEILRIDGYNKIPFPAKLTANLSFSNGLNSHQLIQSVSQYLIGLGFQEIMCNAIVPAAQINPEQGIQLVNSMTASLNSMRTTMLYGGLESIAYNVNRDAKDLAFFEIGSVYGYKKEKYQQQSKLAIWITGKQVGSNWLTKGKTVDFFDIKSVVENLLNHLMGNTIAIQEISNEEVQYGLDFIVNQKTIASCGKTKAPILKQFDLKQDVFFATLDLDALLQLKNKEKIQYKEIVKFPFVRRDLAMIVDEKISFNQINELTKKTGKNLIQEVTLFDVYKGDSIGAGKKSYAISYKLLDSNKTLTDKDIDKTMQSLIQIYEKELQAIIRSN